MKYTAALLCALLNCLPFVYAQDEAYPAIDPTNIEIARDSYGVPYVMAETDAEAAYGLAWVNCEDAFNMMQGQLLIGKGMAGRVEGKDGAEADFFRHFIDAEGTVEYRYETDLSDEYKRYLNGYVQGINAYAAAHPDEILLDKAFPITSKELLQAYVVILSFLTGGADPVADILDGDMDDDPIALGSNVYAANAPKTSDDKTYLCINPHFAMEGPLTFYEAHIMSEEGLNFHGALFHGCASIVMGNNMNLGYSMTWNYFDRGDIYKLKMHDNKKHWYEFDGEYYKLEERQVWLKVKVGFAVIPVPKKTYWSLHGPVLKSADGSYYAVRYPAYFDIRVGEQLFLMNKASNYDEWMEAMHMQALGMFNIGYADKDGNIFYITQGMIPEHPMNYDCTQLLPGEKADALWHTIRSVEELPQVLNPACGYVLNTNNSPYMATCADENAVIPDWRYQVDERPGNNNRGTRLFEQMEESGQISFEDFMAMKWDTRFSDKSVFWQSMQPLFAVSPQEYPEYAWMINAMNEWDGNATLDSKGAAIFGLLLDYMIRSLGHGDAEFVLGIDEGPEEYVNAYKHAQEIVDKYYGGSQDVVLGDYQRLIRGDKDLALPGFADALSPVYPKMNKETGIFKPQYGDTYTQFVKFGKEGPESVKTLVPFGNSWKEDSPHYNDQMEIFVDRQPKTVYMDKATILENADEVYHPAK